MRAFRILAVIGLGLSISACTTTEIATLNTVQKSAFQNGSPESDTLASFEPSKSDAPVVSPDVAAFETSPVKIKSIKVIVPRSLKVSEANRYYPSGDIVWRGDPIGDRHVQVQKIFESGFTRGARHLKGPLGVDIEITVLRFHALTEKARYTIGGVHSITFEMAVKDPETGELVMPVRKVRADLDGFGGQQAVLADAQGQTQKVRITNHLSEVFRQEMTNPDGYKNANLGFFQLINEI